MGGFSSFSQFLTFWRRLLSDGPSLPTNVCPTERNVLQVLYEIDSVGIDSDKDNNEGDDP